MTKRTVSGYVACLMAVVPMAAITATSGCSGEPSADDADPVANEVGELTNKGAADPGPRTGKAGAGAPLTTQPINGGTPAEIAVQQEAAGVACLPGLQPGMKFLCEEALIRFQEIDSIAGATVSSGIPGFIEKGTTESGTGVGPTFNNVGCHVCHSQPGVLGSGVGPKSPQFPGQANPQVAIATLDGAKNIVPSFITTTGPIREVRFKSDSGVHDLYTVADRSDASGCHAVQPPFEAQLAAGNVSFRIPLPTFGDGLVEEITEQDLTTNLAAAKANTKFNTGGSFNLSGNDGTITRFGWKAQNKSLSIFAGEAYNVEQGVSNFLFTTERSGGATNMQGCFGLFQAPEDAPGFLTDPKTPNQGDVSTVNSDIFNFTMAMQLSAPPVQTSTGIPTSACGAVSCQTAAADGEKVFVEVGCANCHTQTFTTPALSGIDPALQSLPFHPFSDFAIHHMGNGLSDGVTQGNAGPDQFRTAPLWGVGQRLFFLHDGRTSDLTAAIAAHAGKGSDANTVIDNFNYLSKSDQQAVLVFLRSL